MNTLFHIRWRFAALAACVACLSVPCLSAFAQAQPERWLSFPTYHNDPAHAVDRAALTLRPDGLLQSASRYPRTDRGSWTAEQNERGWYEYIERLIDCRTGLFLDLRYKLLDQQNQVVAERPLSRERWLTQISLRESDIVEYRWPSSSEIGLACLAAAQPGATIDIGTIDAHSRNQLPNFDPKAVDEDGKLLPHRPMPASSEAFLAMLRADYAARYDGLLLAPPTMEGPRKQARMQTQEATKLSLSDGVEVDIASIRSDGNGLVEATLINEGDWNDLDWPVFLSSGVTRRDRHQIDCRNGLDVLVGSVYQQDGEIVFEQPAPVIRAINTVWKANRWGQSVTWSPLHGPLDPLEQGPMGAVCLYIAARCNGEALSSSYPHFEIDPEALPAGNDPAALLLAARALWQRHQTHFIPMCEIGDAP